MNRLDWTTFDFWFNTVLILYIVNMLFLKALLLRRETRLGVWLAVNNVAFGVAYLTVVAAPWAPWLESRPVQWGVRLVIAFTCTMVVRQFVLIFGGMRGLHREVLRSLRGRPPLDREGY
jgi:hypothetical protein